eukprot:CAMPEP_0181297822 /NCGR_PEP_ID=MMETSP1101-20121128/5452_1 /TAXON_ID=46948 /ORGANISM="Rhodomonas abbreviata, Strain Caron Lab Isolate" /LENGTH=522 /DNA_ID=CAMNT_0023402799 /DNA_START=122 /DNA_END=1690 /DNA_ORIENTATION=+
MTVKWEYRQDLVWVAYDELASAVLESALENGLETVSCEIWNGNTKQNTEYVVDLHRMLQKNTVSNFERNIRRTPAKVFREDPQRPIWQYREEEEWLSCHSVSQEALEAAFSSYPLQQNVRCAFINSRTNREANYSYDLVRMEQTNLETSFKRDVRRVPAVSERQPSVPAIEWGAMTVEEATTGSGSFKSFFKGVWPQEAGGPRDGKVAVLVLRKQSDGECPKPDQEIAMFARLGRHPHLVQLLATSVKPTGEHAMVMEFASMGALGDVLFEQNEKANSVRDAVLLTIAIQVCDGMKTLHCQGILHRDLAARNVLVFGFHHQDRTQVLVKVTDYGLSIQSHGSTITTNSQSTGGPTRWMAPEAIQYRRWSEKSDVYACGMLLWELWARGAFPFFEIDDDVQVKTMVVGGDRPPQPQGCPENVFALMQKCWHQRRDERPSFNRLRLLLEDILIPRASSTSPPPPPPPPEQQPGECVVCLGAPAVACLVPCGHQCVCVGCAPPLALCPMCRAEAQTWVRVYQSTG